MKVKCLLVGMFMTTLLGCSLNTSPQGSKFPLNKTFFLRIMEPGGAWVKAYVAEGGMLKIKNESTGAQVALLPVIMDSDENNITITTYQIINSSSGEKLVQVDSQLMALHSSRMLTNSSLQILLEAITLLPPNKSRISTVSFAEHSGPVCCVTCNGMTWCSNCAVLTSCGCCNTENCSGECDSPPKSNRNTNNNKNKNTSGNL